MAARPTAPPTAACARAPRNGPLNERGALAPIARIYRTPESPGTGCKASSNGGKAQGVSTTMARVERATPRLFEKQYSCALKCR